MERSLLKNKIACYHCGEDCRNEQITLDGRVFCCEGCRLVYSILDQNGLCDYYTLNENPGANRRIPVRPGKFDFLSDKKIQERLISFRNDEQVHVTFYLPQMHCSSCLYLLENLHKLDEHIISGKVNFARKEVSIVFQSKHTTLREVVELLAAIGYEPWISLNDLEEKKPGIDKKQVFRLGIAGFCFGNIMLMSFPEYFGLNTSDAALLGMFRWINLALSLPVFFYSAYPFYASSWKGLRHRFLNIDAPIALAIIITFVRSVWEVVSGTGGGYFDSMTGIVFFMLAGRILQDRTYRQLSFERDYTSYFPIAVSVVKDDKEIPTSLPDIKPGDTLRIHHEELIPADGILTRGNALINYSFVTGESLPVSKEVGELVYAGGKQVEGNIEVLVVKEVAQSYLTQLWNKESFSKKPAGSERSFVHVLSRYFTWIVLTIAAVTAIYWGFTDPGRIWPAVTAIFIIACPCALLLSSTFTNGNILRILSRNKFFLRNAQTIEDIAATTHIVFDKTGTLTHADEHDIHYEGTMLTAYQTEQVAALAACSSHPLSKALSRHLGGAGRLQVSVFKENPGKGIQGFVGDNFIKLGSAQYTGKKETISNGPSVYISMDGHSIGVFRFHNNYREHVSEVIDRLKRAYRLSVLSGDNDAEKNYLRELVGRDVPLKFYQKPEDKLKYIRQLQENGEHVMMIGDGLNDAGALRQSDVGIAVTEQTSNFTPASDAIIEAGQLIQLPRFIRLCLANQRIIKASFALSIAYNLVGLYFAVQGSLSPLIAAILMPSSSLSILLITYGSSNWLGRRLRL